MMAAIAISREDAFDAEFETLAPLTVRATIPAIPLQASPQGEGTQGDAQLDLLRRAFEPADRTSQPNTLSPAFIAFTLIAALMVFWVSGGHVLL